MDYFITQFSPVSSYFLSVKFKCSLQRPGLTHTYVISLGWETKFPQLAYLSAFSVAIFMLSYLI